MTAADDPAPRFPDNGDDVAIGGWSIALSQDIEVGQLSMDIDATAADADIRLGGNTITVARC